MQRPPQPDHLVRMVDTPQGSVRIRTFGEPCSGLVPVVSLMGLAVSDYLVPATAELSHLTQAHLLDLPGLGGSGSAAGKLDVVGYARAVCSWLEGADMPPIVLIGNSSSTQVAAHVAAQLPGRVCALVLASPTVDPDFRSWLQVLLRWRLDGRYPMPGLQQQHTPQWARAGLRQLLHLISVHLQDRLEDTLGMVGCPTLVLRGRYDALSTRVWARRLAGIPPDGRFADMPGPHSFVWNAPDAWCDPVRELAAHACRPE